MTKRLTPRQVECLQTIDRTGDPADFECGGPSRLAFWAREKVIESVVKRGLANDRTDDCDRWTLTDAGRAALAEAEGRKP